jgi:uncharacterized protein involved in tolerance to divalent cations
MILLKISSENEPMMENIASILLTENLAVDINISNNERRFSILNSKIESRPVFILTAKTKALLFSRVEKRIKEITTEVLPEIYSLPITTMEVQQAEKVINQTQKI